MILPYCSQDLFELNENANIYCKDNIIYVDNVYKNYDEILNVLNNAAVENWKLSNYSRNFKDYYDCRLYINNKASSDNIVLDRLKRFTDLINYFFDDKTTLSGETFLRFNYFKHIKNNINPNLQHYPHVDNLSKYNIIIYLDEISKGGTAIYSKLMNVDYSEDENVLVDINKYNYEIVNLVESKPNRCVIFDGTIPHGGYITNHKEYENNWRINQLGLIY